jgi:hypothetical protein
MLSTNGYVQLIIMIKLINGNDGKYNNEPNTINTSNIINKLIISSSIAMVGINDL